MEQQSKSPSLNLVILIIILIACLRFTSGLENVLDIGLFDESGYLYSGLQVGNAGIPGPASAPLYAIWYFLISFLQPDSIALYYLSYKLTIILLPLLFYSLLRRYSVPISVSLIFSWFLLISRANALVWPRVAHFALLLILTTLLIIGCKRSFVWTSLLASIGALLVSYVRPEYFIAYVLFTLLFALLVLRDYKKLKNKYALGLFASGSISALLLGGIGFPVVGDRSWVAFGQHFSLNWVLRNSVDIDPWLNWTTIISHNFGSAHTIPEAVMSNPAAFLMHSTHNLLHFLLPIPALFFPAQISVDRTLITMIALLSIGLFVVYLTRSHCTRLVTLIGNVHQGFRRCKERLVLIGLFLLPAVISIIIIYPRPHYLLLFGVLIAIAVIIVFTNSTGKQELIDSKKIVMLGVLIIFLTPRFDQNLVAVQKPNLSTIQFIQSLEISEPVYLLDADGGYNIYLGSNFHRIEPNEKNTSFDYFRADHNINMIILSDNLLNNARFKNDPEWQRFLADYRQSGYLQTEIPITGRKIILQAKLIPE